MTLCISCKEKHYTPPSLDAVRTAEKARILWSKEDKKMPIHQMKIADSIPKQDSITSKTNEVITDSITTQH